MPQEEAATSHRPQRAGSRARWYTAGKGVRSCRDTWRGDCPQIASAHVQETIDEEQRCDELSRQCRNLLQIISEIVVDAEDGAIEANNRHDGQPDRRTLQNGKLRAVAHWLRHRQVRHKGHCQEKHEPRHACKEEHRRRKSNVAAKTLLIGTPTTMPAATPMLMRATARGASSGATEAAATLKASAQ